MTDKQEKLYVLVGHDQNDAFKGMVEALKRRATAKGDVELIYADPNKTLSQSLSGLKPPANVIIAAHGNIDGTFIWNNGQSLTYNTAFAALPRQGIASVTISGCFGETAQLLTKDLPAGTILQSLVGSRVPNWDRAISQYGNEFIEHENITQTTLLLEALDNTDPRVSTQLARKLGKGPPFKPYKADEVLPHTISIGGARPMELDLDIEVSNLSGRSKSSDQARAYFAQAVGMVQNYFDTKAGGPASNENSLDKRIAAIGKRLGDGTADPAKFTLDEKRIAYAITAAYLHVSGEMQQLVNNAIRISNSRTSVEPVVSIWDGKGSENIARIQAIFEASGISTDNGGTRDGRVSGIEDARTRKIITVMEGLLHIKSATDPTHAKLLDALTKSTVMLKHFSVTYNANNEAVLDVRLVPPPSPSSGHKR